MREKLGFMGLFRDLKAFAREKGGSSYCEISKAQISSNLSDPPKSHFQTKVP